MNIRKVAIWAPILAIVWRQVLLALDHWIQGKWQADLFKRSAMEQYWFEMAAAFLIVLAVAAMITRAAFFFNHAQRRKHSIELAPHLLLCATLFAVSVVLRSPGIFSQLGEMKLEFLGHFLFNASLLWFVVALSLNLASPVEGSATK